MLKYAKVINRELGRVELAPSEGADGYSLMSVLQSDIDGLWYIYDRCRFKTPEQKLKELQNYLVEKVNYVEKANVAYTGVFFDYQGKELIFETNKDSITLITSTLLAISSGATHVKDWKCRESKEPYAPVSVNFTAQQFMIFVNFAQTMIAQAFAVESIINDKIKAMTTYEMHDNTKELYAKVIKQAYSQVQTKLIGVV